MHRSSTQKVTIPRNPRTPAHLASPVHEDEPRKSLSLSLSLLLSRSDGNESDIGTRRRIAARICVSVCIMHDARTKCAGSVLVPHLSCAASRRSRSQSALPSIRRVRYEPVNGERRQTLTGGAAYVCLCVPRVCDILSRWSAHE